jgi:protein gp37
MAENSKIGWTDHTFNGWLGCTGVSPGCDHCYAEATVDKRWHTVHWGPKQPRKRTSAANWKVPLKWNRQHDAFFAAHGRRQRVFAFSLGDWLDNEVPIEWLADLLDLVRRTPNLDWLLLTKRIGAWKARLVDAAAYCGDHPDLAALYPWLKGWIHGVPPANVWLGASVVNQEEADRDIPKLLVTPARVRFLSMEPLLGPVSLRNHLWECCGDPDVVDHGLLGQEQVCCCDPDPRDALDWVITGGESGARARQMDPAWPRSIHDECAAAGVPFFMKQMGGERDKRDELEDLPDDLRVREFPVPA